MLRVLCEGDSSFQSILWWLTVNCRDKCWIDIPEYDSIIRPLSNHPTNQLPNELPVVVE